PRFKDLSKLTRNDDDDPDDDVPPKTKEEMKREKGTRPILHWGIEGAIKSGPLAAPGSYTLRMTVDGQVSTPPFVSVKDPDIHACDDDLVASTRTQVRIRDDMNAAAQMINTLEVLRKKIEERRHGKPGAQAGTPLADLDAKLLAVELRLLSKSDLESDDKFFV